jgi:chromosome segregation ATPase
MSKIIRAFVFIVIIALGATSVFYVMRFDTAKDQAKALEQRTALLMQEKNDLIRQKELEEKQMMMLKKELAGLASVKNIKEQYEQNREKLVELNKNYSMVQKEKDSLKQENLSLNSRVKSLTNEFTRTLETLKEVRNELKAAKSDSTIKGYLSKIEKADELLKEKDVEIKKLAKENSESEKERKLLEKQIKKMEKTLTVTERKLEKAIEASKQTPNDRLKAQVVQLKRELREKESQRRLLNGEVVRLSRERTRLDEQLNFQSEKITSLEDELLDIRRKARNIKRIEAERDQAEKDLEEAEKRLREQEKIITKLKQESSPEVLAGIRELPLSNDSQDTDINKAYALYDTAKAQVVKFSEILMSKEVELETSRQRIKELEKQLQYSSGLSLPEGASEARQYALLKDRIKMLNESMQEKEKQLKEKDEQLAALKMAKETLEEREMFQEKEFDNASLLYSNLKTQMLQATDLLSRREEELISKNKEILGLKSELAILRAEYKVKQQELSDLQDRQRKTMEDLSRATQLNISLQENMVRNLKNSSPESEDKLKAERLKQEIELLMGN